MVIRSAVVTRSEALPLVDAPEPRCGPEVKDSLLTHDIEPNHGILASYSGTFVQIVSVVEFKETDSGGSPCVEKRVNSAGVYIMNRIVADDCSACARQLQ